MKRISLLSLILLLIPGCATPPATDQTTIVDDSISIESVPDAQSGARGRIIDAPRNIRSFAPPSTLTQVDASNIDLRQVFTDLGPDATLWYQHVLTLSNPIFEGRRAGTRGFELATEYVEFWMNQYGLEPAFPENEDTPGGGADAAWTSHIQPFDYGGRTMRKAKLESTRFSIDGDDLKHGRNYVVLAPSGGESITAPLSFVGYGIADGEDGYTSFDEDTDLSGRIAVLLRYEPLTKDGKSQWAASRFSPHANIRGKIRAVVDRGAEGIILVNPPNTADGRTGLESLASTVGWGSTLNVPLVQVTPSTARRLFTASDRDGHSFQEWQSLADAGDITTVNLSDSVQVTLEGRVSIDESRSQFDSSNVGGVLRGKGNLADEWIIIGGHYDHLGYGRGGQLHPGADDNASGTAGVLMMAKRFSRSYRDAPDDANLRSILFMTFGAEEAGLLGSRHWSNHPTLDPDSVSLMINMDMIGRLGDTLMIGGTGTAEEFDKLLPRHIEPSGLTAAFSPGGTGPSDHTNFYKLGIPVLFLFTGIHKDYHQPTDLGYTVNPIGAMQILDLAESITYEVATRPQPLTLRDPNKRATSSSSSSEAPAPSRTQAKVRFGIMPGYGADLETGVQVDEVFPGTSAFEGGVRAGDIIIAWNGEEMTGGRRLAELLREHKPGDIVTVRVSRKGKSNDLKVTLKAAQGSK